MVTSETPHDPENNQSGNQYHFESAWGISVNKA